MSKFNKDLYCSIKYSIKQLWKIFAPEAHVIILIGVLTVIFGFATYHIIIAIDREKQIAEFENRLMNDCITDGKTEYECYSLIKKSSPVGNVYR